MSNLSDWDVLAVDDEPDNLELIELVMEYQNTSVRTTTSASQCLKMLEDAMPSILLMDIQMPDMSGFQLLEIIRDDGRYQNLVIVAVTAHAMDGDQDRILAAGFDGYIPKPIGAMTLFDELKKIVDMRETNG